MFDTSQRQSFFAVLVTFSVKIYIYYISILYPRIELKLEGSRETTILLELHDEIDGNIFPFSMVIYLVIKIFSRDLIKFLANYFGGKIRADCLRGLL